jgi:hypothetical protein
MNGGTIEKSKEKERFAAAGWCGKTVEHTGINNSNAQKVNN